MEDVERFVFCGRQFRGVVGWSNKGSHKLPKTQALGRWEMPAVRGNSGWWHGRMEIIDLKALIELGVGCFHPKNFETTTVVSVWGRNRGGGGIIQTEGYIRYIGIMYPLGFCSWTEELLRAMVHRVAKSQIQLM